MVNIQWMQQCFWLERDDWKYLSCLPDRRVSWDDRKVLLCYHKDWRWTGPGCSPCSRCAVSLRWLKKNKRNRIKSAVHRTPFKADKTQSKDEIPRTENGNLARRHMVRPLFIEIMSRSLCITSQIWQQGQADDLVVWKCRPISLEYSSKRQTRRFSFISWVKFTVRYHMAPPVRRWRTKEKAH